MIWTTLLCLALGDVGIDQRVGESVSLDLVFRDERGAPLRLKEATGGRTTVLALVYYRCPMLCNQILNGLLQTLLELKLDAGRDFNVVALSFDPSEGSELAQARREHVLKSYGRPSGREGWRFLTGERDAVERVCRETGFRTSFDPATGQYAHGAALVVLTPGGKISRYLFGVSYPARELRLSLVEASAGKIATAGDQFLLLCMQYDAASGKYGLAVTRLVKAAAVATVLGLGVLIVLLSRRAKPAAAAGGGS
jgi:protein SCO1/2